MKKQAYIVEIEVWKALDGIVECGENYEVSTLGNVRRIGKDGEPKENLKFETTDRGYKRVRLSNQGNKKIYRVHRLVGLAFLPNPYNKSQINHLDGKKDNNRVYNLAWSTGQENIAHAVENGLFPSGENHHNAKLTDFEVQWIRDNYLPYDKEFGRKALAKKFNVAKVTISKIIEGSLRKAK